MTSGVVLGRLRRGPSGSAVRFELRFGTSPADLWSALTGPARLARWLGAVEGERRPGGEVRLHFGAAVAVLTVRGCLPERRLEVDYRFPDGLDSRLRVELRADDDVTVLVLDHSGFPGTPAPYGAAWQVALDALGSEVRGQVAADAEAALAELAPYYDAAWRRLDGR